MGERLTCFLNQSGDSFALAPFLFCSSCEANPMKGPDAVPSTGSRQALNAAEREPRRTEVVRHVALYCCRGK